MVGQARPEGDPRRPPRVTGIRVFPREGGGTVVNVATEVARVNRSAPVMWVLEFNAAGTLVAALRGLEPIAPWTAPGLVRDLAQTVVWARSKMLRPRWL